MRIVKLDGDFFGKRAPAGIAPLKSAHEICQRAGDEKILLHEAQPLSHARGIVGIQHPRERLGSEGLGHGTDELAMAESLEIEVLGRSRGP